MFTFFRLMSFCLRRKMKMKKRMKIRLRMNLSYSFRLRNRNLRSCCCCGCLKSMKSCCSCFPMNMKNCCCCGEQSIAPVMMKTLRGYMMSRTLRMNCGCRHCRCSGWL